MNRQITRVWMMALGLAVAVAASPVMAQGQGGQGRGGFRGRGGFSILRMPMPVEARLNLNADQKTKIQAISERFRAELRDLFQPGGDRAAATQKLRAANEKAESEAVALLDAGQKKQYEEIKEEAASYAGLDGAGMALLSVTDLNADQKAKLKALAATAAASRPQPTQGGDRAAAAQARMARDEANRTAVKAILTPAQQTQYDAAVAASRQRRPRPNNQ